MTAEAYNKRHRTWSEVSELVWEFQLTHSLHLDGKAGPVTMAKLREVQARRSDIAKVWPLAVLPDGRRPVVTNHYRHQHHGWDIFYPYLKGDPIASAQHVVAGGGRTRYWYPAETLAYAVADGVVVCAESMSTGLWVWVAHADGMATGYFHGSNIFVAVGAAVKAGDPLLRVGYDIRREGDPIHLHFEVRRISKVDDPRYWDHLDPKAWMLGAGWLSRSSWLPVSDRIVNATTTAA